ncbi:DUF3592 domain-containing protein [Streptomyces sp. NPDC002851]
MDFVIVAVPTLLAAVAAAIGAVMVRRVLQLRRARTRGRTAEARCLRTYTTTRRDDGRASTTLHHVYEFRTPEGRAVRFEEANGPASVGEGDLVPVYYTADRPERATAHAPRPAADAAAAAGLLLVLILVVALCVGLATSSRTEFGRIAVEDATSAALPF